ACSGSRRRRGELPDGFLPAAHRGFERDDLGIGRVELLERLERVLGHEPLQEVDVALEAAGPLVQAGGLRAVLYARNILRLHGSGRDHDQAQAQRRQFDHLLSPPGSPAPTAGRRARRRPSTGSSRIRLARSVTTPPADLPLRSCRYRCEDLERVKGIEPSSSAWKAGEKRESP